MERPKWEALLLIETFELERTQSIWENTVDYNLTETGVHPFSLEEFLTPEERDTLLKLELGYGQTNGDPVLREVISDLYPGAGKNNVLVTTGSIEANFVAVWSLLEPGYEVLCMLPNYMQIIGLARSLGITVRTFQLKEELGWQPDLNELAEKVTPKTKMIAICNPNNPTGAILSEESRAEVLRQASSVGAWLFADEVYRGAELSGVETQSFYGTYDKVIVTGGLSKAYALPGLRLGWLTGPVKAMEEAWARRDYTTIATSVISQQVGEWALREPRRASILERNRTLLRANMAQLQTWAEKYGDLFRFQPTQAGGMSFMKYDLPIGSRELVEALRKEQSTFVVAGQCFGMEHWIRIGIGGPSAYLAQGLARIDTWLSENRTCQ